MSNLENTLKQLRLSGLLQTLNVRLQEAVANWLGHAQFLDPILSDQNQCPPTTAHGTPHQGR